MPCEGLSNQTEKVGPIIHQVTFNQTKEGERKCGKVQAKVQANTVKTQEKRQSHLHYHFKMISQAIRAPQNLL